jgi:DNA-binding transcriptional LysR family regulator
MNLNRVDLNLLVAFDVLMAERSVTRAAERLSIGQSAMSSTLARLRKLFKDPLLVRDGRSLVATPAAEALVEPVRDVVNRVEWVLSRPRGFDPARDNRTFSIIANDYLTMTFLQPLMTILDAQAPSVRLRITPTGDDFVERISRHQADLLLMPREAFAQFARVEDFPHRVLFRDRYLCAVDKDHPDVGDEITLEQFSTLPYLAMSSGTLPSLAELQLNFLGVPRNTEVTAGFVAAPFLLRGTRMVTLIHEILARRLADMAGLRLLEPPIPRLQPITETMVWSVRYDADPGHQWLRQTMIDLAAKIS